MGTAVEIESEHGQSYNGFVFDSNAPRTRTFEGNFLLLDNVITNNGVVDYFERIMKCNEMSFKSQSIKGKSYLVVDKANNPGKIISISGETL